MKIHSCQIGGLLLSSSLAVHVSVRLVGGSWWNKLGFTRDETGLHVSLPEKFNGKIAFVLKIRP